MNLGGTLMHVMVHTMEYLKADLSTWLPLMGLNRLNGVLNITTTGMALCVMH
jgi:hypothetical protein